MDLAVDRDRAPASSAQPRPLEAEVTVLDALGEPAAGIIVFLTDGYLSMLEIYQLSDASIAAWPPLDRLQLILNERNGK